MKLSVPKHTHTYTRSFHTNKHTPHKEKHVMISPPTLKEAKKTIRRARK